MSIDRIKAALPACAKDLKLNLSSVLSEETLDAERRWGVALASAIAARNPQVVAALEAEAAHHLAPETAEAARAAAAIMGMNNVYYRFVHLVGGDYATMPARLRMNVIARPGVGKEAFELFCLAVSALNGCGMCMEAHERALRAEGVSAQEIQAAVRIAAVVHGVAACLEGPGEAALAAAE